MSTGGPGGRSKPTETPDGERSRLEELLRPFYTDSALFPVTIVGVTILVVFGASLLLLATSARNGFAIAAVAVLVWMTADAVRGDLRRRRFGIASRIFSLVWGLAGLVAAGAVWLGIY